MSTPPVTIVTPRRRLIGLAVVCAVFTAMGAIIWALRPEEMLNLIVGAAAIAFFGLGGGFSIISQLRRSTVLVADDDGIDVRGAGKLAWGEIDKIDADAGTLGIRLRSTKAFLAQAPKEYTAESMRASRATTGWDLTWAAGALDRPPREAAAALRARRVG